jgi:hypothetical protein
MTVTKWSSLCVLENFNKNFQLLIFLQCLLLIIWLIHSKLWVFGQKNIKKTPCINRKKYNDISARLEHSPQKSLAKVVQQAKHFGLPSKYYKIIESLPV